MESCRPKREQSYSPEDDERADLQLKVSETDTMSDDDSFEEAPPPEENEEEVTEELFEKFKQNEETFARPVEDAAMFADIEVEEEARRERKEPEPEAMLESPDQSFEIEEVEEEESCASSVSHTSENLQPQDKPEERKFCCRKHRLLFAQSQSSIRRVAVSEERQTLFRTFPDFAPPSSCTSRCRVTSPTRRTAWWRGTGSSGRARP